MLICPKYYLIDTNQLNKWVEECGSSNRTIKTRAILFRDKIKSLDFIPVITIEHMIEIMSYANVGAIHQRLNVLQSLDFKATVASRDGGPIGSALDVGRHELEVLLASPKEEISLVDVRSRLVQSEFDLSFLLEDPCAFEMMRSEARIQAEAFETTVGISKIPNLYDPKETLGSTLSRGFRSKHDRLKTINLIGSIVTKSIEKFGDKRTQNPNKIGDNFAREVIDLSSLISDDSFLEQISNYAGVPYWAINYDDSLQHFSHLVNVGAKSKFYANVTGADHEKIFKIILSGKLISFEIESGLYRNQDQNQRARRSYCFDTRFACLSPYLDRVYLDKQMYDNVVRTKRKKAPYSEIMHVEKVCNYFETECSAFGLSRRISMTG